jgi:hypothetical protein
MATRSVPSATPTWIYFLIVAVLGITLIVGVVCWVWLTFEDKQVPDSLATLLATIAGGLVGALTMGNIGGERAGSGEGPGVGPESDGR